VRRNAADNINIKLHALEKLAKDKYPLVRGSVAKNPNTPNYIQEILSEDASEYVQKSLNDI
jgi:hypothetical protein